MRAILLGIGLLAAAFGAAAQMVQPLFRNSPAAVFTEEDNRLYQEAWKKALEEIAEGQSLDWTNPKTGHGGELTTLRSFEWRGYPCKENQIRNQAQGRKSDEKLNACRMEGAWKLLSAEQLKK